MTDPLRLSFELTCPLEHAFAVWTARIGAWWPADHTVSGQPDTTVVLEPRCGGRIYERTVAGVEHDWGQVTTWSPPTRLGYLWHLGRDRSSATQVEITFTALADSTSRIDIEHHGWEQLGDQAATWRARNRAGWDSLIPHFRTALQKGTEQWQPAPTPTPGD